MKSDLGFGGLLTLRDRTDGDGDQVVSAAARPLLLDFKEEQFHSPNDRTPSHVTRDLLHKVAAAAAFS